ncbi:transcriptional regulator [Encephalitozoon cuniculi]|nr:transcriptional regulator [Encephalitozoon cuniculi]
MHPGYGESIRCYCRLGEEDPDMLHCDTCGNWLHTVCCGFFSNKDRRIPRREFSCFYCTRHITKADSADALFRRILSIVYTEGLKNKVWLCHRLGITEWQSSKQTRKMADEGFIRVVGKHRAISYEVVKTQETKDKIRSYFGA